MAYGLGNVAASAMPRRALPARPYGMHTLVDDDELRVSDCVCGHGRRSPTSAGEFWRARVAVMLAGAFHVRGSGGDALVGANAMLVGNAAAAYEFRHVDDGGDRSLVCEYSDALLDEVAAAAPRPARGGFRGASVPSSPGHIDAVALAETALCDGDADALREAALVAAGVALAGGDGDPGAGAESLAQAARVARTLRYIEAHFADDC